MAYAQSFLYLHPQTKSQLMQTLALEGMRFYAYHGFYKKERKTGGEYQIDLYLRANFDLAIRKDKLKGTINYETAYNICAEEMAISSKLIEHVAGRISQRLEKELPTLAWYRLRISKVAPPIKGPIERTYFEMEQSISH